MSYAKLFSSITESSLWCEPDEVRILFVSMLAKADATGFVEAALPGLARLSNLSLDRTARALKVLQSPDPHSKNTEHEGRRILAVPGGWMLLNYEGYRKRKGNEERQNYMRDYMREYRKNRKQPVNSVKLRKTSPSASASASSLTSKESSQPRKLPFTSEAFRNAWNDWESHRREIKKPLTPTQIEKQLLQFEAWGEERSIKAIEHTIAKGWQGLREDDAAPLFNSRGGKPRVGPGQTYDPNASLKAPDHGNINT